VPADLLTLHPLALAGVWDHPNSRAEVLERLRRTTRFIGGTTYASRVDAKALIAHVQCWPRWKKERPRPTDLPAAV